MFPATTAATEVDNRYLGDILVDILSMLTVPLCQVAVPAYGLERGEAYRILYVGDSFGNTYGRYGSQGLRC